MIHIDGSFGEGGGQVLRTSLAMSLVTGKPFLIKNIRAGRRKPGLMRQHLTAANAASEIGKAEIKGNSIGSGELFFSPVTVDAGDYLFSVGTAGSCTLVLQTILPSLLLAKNSSRVVLEGGTHNPYAPPFDFLVKAFLPLINKMGPEVTSVLERPGFYPAGGGRFTVNVKPTRSLNKIDLSARGRVINQRAIAKTAKLPISIANRELKILKDKLNMAREDLIAEDVTGSMGPGNILTVEIESENITEMFTGFGERGVTAEKVANKTVTLVQKYLNSKVPVAGYLADQLLIPMALAGGGKFRTLTPSRHTLTNIEVLKQFLDIDVSIDQYDENACEIKINGQPYTMK